jgi:hypothetical protein
MVSRRAAASHMLRRAPRYPDHFGFSTVPPIDPLMIDYWDANVLAATAADPGVFLVGGQVDSWKGHRAGIVVTAPAAGQRPLYGTDSSLLGNVVQCTVASSRCLVNTAAGTIVANGTRPYTLSAFRLSTAPGASVIYGIFALGVVASQDRHFVHYQTFGGSQLRPNYNNNAVNVQATATADTLSHVVEFWPDGANLICRDNRTQFQTASAVALGADCTAIAFGRSSALSNSFANANLAWNGLFSGKPSDSYIDTLMAWLSYWKGTAP